MLRADVLTVEFFKLVNGNEVGRLTEPCQPLPPFEDRKDMVSWCKTALSIRHTKTNSDWPDAVRLCQYDEEIYRWTEWDRLKELSDRRLLRMNIDDLAKRVKELRDEIKQNLDKLQDGTHTLAPAPPYSADELKRVMEETVEDLTKTLKRYGKK